MDVQLNISSDVSKLLEATGRVEAALTGIKDASEKSNTAIQANAEKSAQSVGKLDAALGKTGNALAVGNAQLSKAGDSFGRLAVSSARAELAQKLLEQQLADTIGKGVIAAETFGENSEEAKKYYEEVVNITKAMKDMNSGMGETDDSMQSLAVAIREAKQESAELMHQYEQGLIPKARVDESIERVAHLKDRQNELNKQVKLFNPEDKFAAFSALARGAAGGVEAVVGAMNLLGIESKSAEKSLIQIQAAMAFSSGIKEVLEFGKTVKDIGASLGIFTKAKAVNVVVTEAQTVATGHATAAIGAEAVATTGATVATQSFTAALLANPFTATLVALLAITAAIVVFTDDTEEAAEKVKDLVSELEELDRLDSASRNFERKLVDVTASVSVARAGEDAKAVLDIEQDKVSKLKRINDQEVSSNEDLIQKLQILNDKADEETVKAIKEKVNKLVDANDELRRANTLLDYQSLLNEEAYNKTLKSRQEKRLKDLKQFLNDLDALYRQLQGRFNEAELSIAGDQSKLFLQRQNSLQELADFKKLIEDKGKLTDANFKLGAKQLEQFKLIEYAIEEKYSDASEDLLLSNIAARTVLIEEARTREIAAYEAEFSIRKKQLLKQGATEDEIAALRIREMEALTQKYIQADLSQQEQIDIARVAQQERSQKTFEEFERDKQRQILQIQYQYARIKLDALKSDGTMETEVLRENLKATIKTLGDELKKPTDKKFSWFDLFGLSEVNDGDKKKFDNAMGELGNYTKNIADSFISEKERMVQAQIDADQKIIDSLSSRIDEQQGLLEQEIANQKDGYANNVQAKRDEIALLKSERDKEIAHQELLIKKKEKLARQAAIADSIATSAKLILAAAEGIEGAAKVGGPIGIVLGLAQAAALIAGFLAIKGKIQSATAMGSGGKLPFGLLVGDRHKPGVSASGMQIGDSDIWAEGGEYLNSRKATDSYSGLLESINRNKLSGHGFKDLRKLLNESNVSLLDDVVPNAVSSKSKIDHYNILYTGSASHPGTEKKLDAINKSINELKATSKPESTTYLPDGTKVITRGNNKTIIRKG